MENIIQRFAIPPVTKCQQFLINLLCGIVLSVKILTTLVLRDKNKVTITVKEHYEQKLGKNGKLMEMLESENRNLLEENQLLKDEVSLLQNQRNLLSYKLRTTNNMIRILTKNKEDASSYRTPARINVSDVDTLLRKKLNECRARSNNKKDVKFAPATVGHKVEVKKVAVRKETEIVSSSVKSTLKRDTHKQKQVPGLPSKIQANIVPNNPSSKKSAILIKCKEDHGIASGAIRIISKAKGTGKLEEKLIDGQTMKKRAEPKNGDSKIQKVGQIASFRCLA